MSGVDDTVDIPSNIILRIILHFIVYISLKGETDLIQYLTNRLLCILVKYIKKSSANS